MIRPDNGRFSSRGAQEMSAFNKLGMAFVGSAVLLTLVITLL
jgi:hypothetical protein